MQTPEPARRPRIALPGPRPARLRGATAILLMLGLFTGAPADAEPQHRQPAPPVAGRPEVRVETLVYGEAPADSAPAGTRRLRLDLYRPAGESAEERRPAVVLMHGGGFVGGRRDLPENRELARTLASRGYAVASIDYRLWPDRPAVSAWARDLADRVAELGLPLVDQMEARHGPGWTTAVGAAAEDALRALTWLGRHGPEHGVDPDRLALGGMSAGGLTALEVAYRLSRRGVDVPELSAVISVRGAWLLARGEEACLLRPDGPPLFVVHGTADTRVPFREALRTYRAARASGVPVAFHPLAGVGHGDPEAGGAEMLRVRLDDGTLIADRLDRFLAAAFTEGGAPPPVVCVASGGPCPEPGRARGECPVDAGAASDGGLPAARVELTERAAALLASVSEEPGFVEELMGYRRARDLLREMGDGARRDWSYWPRPRVGLALGRMTARQRGLVQDYLASLLSARGYLKVGHVTRFEDMLEEREAVGFARGAENYTTTIFGKPDTAGAWGLRFEGHHVSLNLTVAGGEVRVTPSFLGVSPAELSAGPHAGFRPLRHVRAAGRELFLSLRPEQVERALLSDTVPGDILTSPFGRDRDRRDEWRTLLRPDGVSGAELDPDQREILLRLVDQVLGDYRPEIASAYRARIDPGQLRFAWMGSSEPGAPQYFRLQGRRFVFELDASQEQGDHVHTVWRDREGDFGEDALRRHYRDHRH